MNILIRHNRGFTLIEVVAVIVITGILLTVALGTGKRITDTARTEQTLGEMDRLATAIIGDPNSYSNGTRTEFGYVGDIGSLPPNLDALAVNPGAYSTWNGPYVDNRFIQTASDYKEDAWGVNYLYAAGTNISSTGSGETITRKFAGSTDELLLNSLSGNLYDAEGQPPGSVFKDSVAAILSFPNGTGGIKSVTVTPDMGGYFTIDSLPIGNHDMAVVYYPSGDTLKRFVVVLPNSNVYEEYRLPFTSWTSSGGGLDYIPGSGVVTGAGSHCDGIEFEIINNSSSPIDISSITLSWSTPVSFYKGCQIGYVEIFRSTNPRNGSGDMITFPTIVINPGVTETISFEHFDDNPTGGHGNKTNMQSTDFTVLFSDGTSFSFSTGTCP